MKNKYMCKCEVKKVSEYERYFIMSLDTDEEFVFDRVDVDANKIFGDIKISFEDAVDLLNKQDTEIKELEKELTLMKDKAYYYGCCAIGETSSNYDKDIDEFRKEIYGEEKAEQIKQQEIKEHQESLQRLKEQRLVKVNCYKCKHGVWFGNEEGLTCEKRIKPFPNECEYFVRH